MPTLLEASGPGWRLEIVGKLPALPPFLDSTPEAFIVASPGVVVAVWDPPSETMVPLPADGRTIPLFFEAVAYDIHLDRDDVSSALNLPPGAELRRSRPMAEHYSLNFGNNVGFADIGVAKASGYVSLRIEVFSRKADYRTDYETMRAEVSAILRNLAMGANAKTHSYAAPERGGNPTLTEWFALLRALFEEFAKLASAIAKAPHSGLSKSAARVPTERARRVGRRVIDRALRRENGGAALPGLGLALPRKIDQSVSRPTLDTPENRYYKALIVATYRNMRALSKTQTSGDEDANRYSEKKFFDAIRPKLAAMERRVEAILGTPFLAQVADVPLARPASMVFHSHPLYSRFDKLCRALNGGLTFGDKLVPIGVKETSLLYEYWCFLRLISLLRDRFDLVEQTVVRVNRLKATVSLAKGMSSAMRFTHRPTGKPLYLVYNRLFNRLPTIDQKPDNVIQFASDSKFYIFDAKYKIQFDRAYVDQYGGPGPTTEDINAMHRYRDAIAVPHPLRPQDYSRGVVAGAVVLFPYPDEEKYKTHRFHNSIAQVEIGGLPFLPGATALVAAKLSALLAADYPDPVADPPS